MLTNDPINWINWESFEASTNAKLSQKGNRRNTSPSEEKKLQAGLKFSSDEYKSPSRSGERSCKSQLDIWQHNPSHPMNQVKVFGRRPNQLLRCISVIWGKGVARASCLSKGLLGGKLGGRFVISREFANFSASPLMSHRQLTTPHLGRPGGGDSDPKFITICHMVAFGQDP